MRTVCLAVLVLLAACKEKQQAKPTPAPEPTPAKQQETPRPALPAEPTPTAPPPTAPPPTAPHAIKPAGGFTTVVDYENKAFDLIDKLGNVFSTAGTDCEKLADNLEIFADENKAAFDATQAFEAANPKAEEALEAKLAERTKQFMLKVQVSMKACQKNERVTAALKKLPD